MAYEGRGSTSLASASMMTEAVRGLSAAAAAALADTVRRMMHGELSPVQAEEALGDLAALQVVVRFPVRVKSALLPWMALREALAREGAPAAPAGARG